MDPSAAGGHESNVSVAAAATDAGAAQEDELTTVGSRARLLLGWMKCVYRLTYLGNSYCPKLLSEFRTTFMLLLVLCFSQQRESLLTKQEHEGNAAALRTQFRICACARAARGAVSLRVCALR